ncbi:MAG: phage tail spike protein, partial [Clostridia bacterium]
RYRVKYEVYNKRRKKHTWDTGWVAQTAIEFELVGQPLPSYPGAIENLCPAVAARPQIFDILSVKTDVKSGEIQVYAVHMSYRLSRLITNFKYDKPLTAAAALNGAADGAASGILGGIEQDHDFTARTDIGDTRTSCDWTDVNPIEALLDPETGFAARWGAKLVRDNESLFFLRDAGLDRGVRIQHGKNLTGATMGVDLDGMVTAIKPKGTNADGTPLYLTDDPGSPDNYIMSPNAAIYGMFCEVLDCEDCQVEKDKKGVTKAIARARMREQAQRRFDADECDRPQIDLTVNFVQLGDAEEYVRYAALEQVFLWDHVAVAARDWGIEAVARVTRTKWDCLRGRMIEIELGDAVRTNKIYTWQLPAIGRDQLKPGTIQDTPMVQLSGSSLVVTADQDGACAAIEAEYKIVARVGYRAVEAEIGTITGLPPGMMLTLGEADRFGDLPFTIAVSKGATLGTDEQAAGQIKIPVSYPTDTTLAVNWAKICEGADGKDGKVKEFVYKLTRDYASPPIDSTPHQDNFIPEGWEDDPHGISAAWPCEWVSTRDRLNNRWMGFGTPKLWARWAPDGTGAENIYYRTAINLAPLDSLGSYLTSPVQQDGAKPANWSGEPVGVTRDWPFEWVSQRKKIAGVWGVYSAPALCARLGSDGISVTLSDTAILMEADNGGVLTGAFSATVRVRAMRGALAAPPGVAAVSGLPSGIACALVGVDEATNEYRITLTAPAGTAVGGMGSRAGLIYIQVDDPIDTTLGLAWAKICMGAQGTSGTDGSTTYRQSTAPERAKSGDVWVDTTSSTIKTYNGSAWEIVYLSASYITSGQISTNLLDAVEIVATYLASNKITANQINAQGLSVGTIWSNAFSLFSANVGSSASNYLGMAFNFANEKCGELNVFKSASTGEMCELSSPGALVLSGYSNKALIAPITLQTPLGALWVGGMHGAGTRGMICGMHVLPEAGNTYDLGGDGNGQKWRRLYTNNTVSVSDVRDKHDIAPLDALDLLGRLRPVRYRLNEDRDERLRFGFVAQEVAWALEMAGIEGADLLMNDNPNHLGLCYTELIAVLVEGHQDQAKKLAELSER